MQGFKEWLIKEESRIICETAEMTPLEKQQYRDARAIFRKYVFEVPNLSIGTTDYITYKYGNLFMGTPDKFITDLEKYKPILKQYIINYFESEYKRLYYANLNKIPEDHPKRKKLIIYIEKEGKKAAEEKMNKTIKDEMYNLNNLISYFKRINRINSNEIVKFDFSDATGSFL